MVRRGESDKANKERALIWKWNYATNWLSPGIIFFLCNLPFFLLGWIKLSPRFVLYSLYAMLITSVSYELISITVNIQEQIYAAVACGVLSGLGGGLIPFSNQR